MKTGRTAKRDIKTIPAEEQIEFELAYITDLMTKPSITQPH